MPDVQWISTAITAASTLGAALGGVWLTQRHQLRVERTRRRAEDASAYRELLARLSRTAHEWTELMEALLPVLSRFAPEDHLEFASTDSGQRLGELRGALSAAFGEAALLIGDARVALPLARAYALYSEVGEKAIDPVTSRAHRAASDDDKFEHLMGALRHVWAFRSSIHDLEAAAAPLVRITIDESAKLVTPTRGPDQASPRPRQGTNKS